MSSEDESIAPIDGAPEYINVLRREFSASEGSFLFRLRVELYWDKAAFSRLTDAMYAAVKHADPEAPIERWLADGFWYLQDFVQGHTSHPNFPRPEPPEYHDHALRRLRDLASYLFTAESPYQGDTGFEPM